jgi:hypothetical protein
MEHSTVPLPWAKKGMVFSNRLIDVNRPTLFGHFRNVKSNAADNISEY